MSLRLFCWDEIQPLIISTPDAPTLCAAEHSAFGNNFKVMLVTVQTPAHLKLYRRPQSTNSWLPWNGICAHPYKVNALISAV